MKKLKQILCTLLMSVALSGLLQAQEKAKKVNAAKADNKAPAAKMDNAAMPYTATYSSKFEMGDPAKSRLVLEMWKDFDDNAFERHADMFADTAVIYLADGAVIKGKDKMMEEVKKYRSSLEGVKSDVHAYMSFRSVDQNHDWVAIWGTENDTMKDGTKTSSNLHEVWRFNKDGKVDVIRQFMSKTPPTQ